MAIFKGTGLVWDKEQNKPLCKFEDGIFETSNKRTIEILKNIESIVVLREDNNDSDESKKTKKQLVIEAKEAGIKGADRMSAEELSSLLEE